MKRTYMIQNEKGVTIEFFRRLRDARSFLVKNFDQDLSILALHGCYFGEGRHVYRMKFNSNNFKFFRIKV